MAGDNNNTGSKDLMSWGSGWFDSLFNAGMNIYNATQQQKWNKQQQKNWETQFDYIKWLNNVQMEREDTAVQRSVADHQAAGFNKLLAIGQPSQAGTLTSFQGNAGGHAPSIDEIKNPIESYLEQKQLASNIQLTEAQAKLVGEQANTEKTRQSQYSALTDLYKIQTAKTNAEKERATINYLRDWHDFILEVKNNIKSNDSNVVNNPWSAGWRLINQSLPEGMTTKDLFNLDTSPKNKNNFLNFLKENGLNDEEANIEIWNEIQKTRK